MLHVKVLRSHNAHARVKEIDTSRVQRTPGVVDLLTPADVPNTLFTTAGHGYPQRTPHDQHILTDHPRYV